MQFNCSARHISYAKLRLRNLNLQVIHNLIILIINNNTINGKKPKLHAEKKKDYKKLLRPEMFNVKDEIKKSPFEVKITKVQNKNKSNFAEENKNSKDQNTTTRNVIIC